MASGPSSQSDGPSLTGDGASFSVIIPAHNEEAVIERCLRSIYSGANTDNNPEVIVAANGCTDQTVARARAAAPNALILDIQQPSKAGAINQASSVASHFPRLIMDADIEASFDTLAATADVLRQGRTLAASPLMKLNLAQCSRAVRSYYKVWLTLPYAANGLIGGGVYGLSQEGWERVAPLPDIIGDDLYVRTRFAQSERANISHTTDGHAIGVTMTPPTTLSELIKIEARRRMGKHEVDRHYPTPQSGNINSWRDLFGSLSKGANLLDLAIYITVKMTAYARFKFNLVRGKREWARDASSRIA